jgi:hypothetical protein
LSAESIEGKGIAKFCVLKHGDVVALAAKPKGYGFYGKINGLDGNPV